jgi:acyl carrier protein
VPAETDAQAGQIDRAEVLRVIKDQLADILEIDGSTINEGDSFAEDLHLGSLELIELVEAIEEEFGERSAGFRVEDEDLEDLKPVRDAVDYVIARL